MANLDFSVEKNTIFSLMRDLTNGTCSLEGGLTVNDMEEHLRTKLKGCLYTEGLKPHQSFRRNKYMLFEIIEEMIDIVVAEDVLKSAFIDQFVEVKNRVFGDKTEWVTEGDSLLTVASFAGNHWDTDRQYFDSGEKFTLESEWAYVHVYMEFERFMLGIDDWGKLTKAVTDSFARYIDERVFAQFHGIASAVPSEFIYNGNDEEAILGLCEKLEVFGGYSNLTICGTKAALRKLGNIIPIELLPETLKEQRALQGAYGVWNGYKLMPIPQVKKNDAFELALDNNQLFVIGSNSKPIKLEYIGDTRTKTIDDEHINNDLTFDFQIQTRFAMGMLLPDYFGMITLA